mmetsp:Transcript_4136/g.4753  ORF Transcript_4136/g.4753 Transcript_4136/m.4753 type:complete len:643 (-) Transcript_4136:982-2910(-)|eukprot:CAMPEP_0197846024 /NCGR_PEP_ID=MMETSP1438-20131217/2852_1 /TAXON_ID=1461541 /ORGANISM="Pterosperma sp., Strain CCMP1384" /LENGTH=642 /DNA_ID=CAMNT_0043457529 /DNA_START=122 /DNA_END=2050 /DNA_ORIENTATION=-
MGSCSSKASVIGSPTTSPEAKNAYGSWQRLETQNEEQRTPVVEVDDQTADRLKSNGTSEPTGRQSTEKQIEKSPSHDGKSFAASFIGGVRKGANTLYNIHSMKVSTPSGKGGGTPTSGGQNGHDSVPTPQSSGKQGGSQGGNGAINSAEDDPDSREEPQDLRSRRNRQKNNSRLVIFPPNTGQLSSQVDNSTLPAQGGTAASSLAMLPGSIATPKNSNPEADLQKPPNLPPPGDPNNHISLILNKSRPSSHQSSHRNPTSPDHMSSKPGSAPPSPLAKLRRGPKSPVDAKNSVLPSVVSEKLTNLKKKRPSLIKQSNSRAGSSQSSRAASQQGSTGQGHIPLREPQENHFPDAPSERDEHRLSDLDHPGMKDDSYEQLQEYDPYYGYDVNMDQFDSEVFPEDDEVPESEAVSSGDEPEPFEAEEASIVICPPRDTPNTTGWDGGWDGMGRPTSARPYGHERTTSLGSGSGTFKVSDTELQVLRQRHAEVQMLLRLDLTSVFAITHAQKAIERLHDFLQDVHMTASHLHVEPQAVYQHLLQRIAAETTFYGMGVDASLMSRPDDWDQMLRMAEMLTQLHGRQDDGRIMASMMSCAVELRQVLRIKVQDNNDLRTATRALEDALDFFTVFAMVSERIQNQILIG